MIAGKRDLIENYLLDYNIFSELSQFLWAKKERNYFWLFLNKIYTFFFILLYLLICLFDILYLILLIMLSYKILYNIAENFEKFNIYFFVYFFGLLISIIISFTFIINFLFYLSKDFNILKYMLFNFDLYHIYINISDNILNNGDIFFVYLYYFALDSYDSNNFNVMNENLMNYFQKMPWNLNKKKSVLFYCYIYIYFILKFIYKLCEKFNILVFLILVIFPLNFIIFFLIFLMFFYWLFNFLESLIFKLIINELNSIFYIWISCIPDKELFKIFEKSFEFYNSKFTFEEFLNIKYITYTQFISLNIEIHKRLLKYINNK